jgi:hypothetical protein
MGYDTKETKNGFSFQLTGVDKIVDELTDMYQKNVFEAAAQAQDVGAEAMKDSMAREAPVMSGFLKQHFITMHEPFNPHTGEVKVHIQPDASATYPVGADRQKKHTKDGGSLSAGMTAYAVALWNELGHRIMGRAVEYYAAQSYTKSGKLRKNAKKLTKPGEQFGTYPRREFMTHGFEGNKNRVAEIMFAKIKEVLGL